MWPDRPGRADAATREWLARQHAAYADSGGAGPPPAWMARAGTISRAGRRLAQRLRHEQPQTFAGSAQQPTREGMLVWLGFTHDVDRALEGARAGFPHPEALRAFQPRRTLAELEAVRDEIRSARRALSPPGGELVAFGIDEASNQVTVDVRGPLEGARAALSGYGEAVRVREVGLGKRVGG
jgi:hypothetical protein